MTVESVSARSASLSAVANCASRLVFVSWVSNLAASDGAGTVGAPGCVGAVSVGCVFFLHPAETMIANASIIGRERMTDSGPSRNYNASMIETPPETISVVVRQATGLRRWLYLGAGLLFVGVGILGAILPVLPTTPWILLAGACFARSSPRLHRWLKRSPYFGHLLGNWETHRGIRWRVKLFAVGMVITVIGLTVAFGRAPDWAK